MLIERPRIPIREVLLYGLWPSFIKVWLYRLVRGYRIGKGVSIAFPSVISGEVVEVGEHTSIGFMTVVRGKEIRIGSHVQIGSTTFLDTPYIEIGDGTRINEQVFVGGLQYPDSRFVLGRNCQIMQMSFINPARSVIVGDDSGIGGHSLIFGHTSWLSQFEGYPVNFQPIEIGKSVSIAWRVFILPGSTIGDGAVVGANSVVQGKIPPRCLAMGYPARVISKAPDFPKDVTAEEKIDMFRNIVREMIDFFSGSGLICNHADNKYEVRKPSQRWWAREAGPWRLYVTDQPLDTSPQFSKQEIHVFLSLQPIPSRVRNQLAQQSIMWIDVANKEQSRISNDLGDEVSLFLKRYGVRTLRSDAIGTRNEASSEQVPSKATAVSTENHD